MQFLVSTFILQEKELPLHRVGGVFIVAAGAAWMATKGGGGADAGKGSASYTGPLPTGAGVSFWGYMTCSALTEFSPLAPNGTIMSELQNIDIS